MTVVDHADRDHAVISPSSAHRWMHCTPSPLLEAKFPDTTSEAAKEGTLAHELAEAKLQNYFNTKDFSKRKLTTRTNKLKKDPLWQPEIDSYTDEYLDFVKSEAMKFKHSPYVEIEKKIDLSMIIPGGFGTADCVLIGDGTLEVIDFKYGKGVLIDVVNNPQLQLYAAGMIEEFLMIFAVSEIKLAICQPRIENSGVWVLSPDQLYLFEEDAKRTAEKAAKGEGECVPGDWCRFCRAKAQCRARADENVKLAFCDTYGSDPKLLDNNEIGKYLTQGEDVARWLSDLKEYALSECLAGRDVEGFKAVEGRGSRVWADMEKAFEIIEAGGTDEAMLYERSPLSLAKVEKLLGKKEFAEEVGDYVIKSPGKPTLVPESDKRTAITTRPSAEEAFKEEK